MFFPDLLPSEADRADHKKVCEDFSAFLKDCLSCLVEAYKVAEAAAATSTETYHSTIFLLSRHVIEYVDGVALLISQGGSQPCLPLLRSALEATMGVMYILKADTKRRALAYQVAHTHQRIKLYEQMDPTTSEGKAVRAYLGDEADTIFGRLPIHVHLKLLDDIKNLRAMLAKPDFAPIEAAWQAQGKKEPNWYSLFGGPQNARGLATEVGWALMYDFAYKAWSNEIHAGSAMKAAGRKDGTPVMRPIRHPEELQPSLIHAMNFTLQIAFSLIKAYAPVKHAEFQRRYVESIRQRKMELLDSKIISAPWRDTKGIA